MTARRPSLPSPGLRLVAPLALAAALATGCAYHLERSDLFPYQSPPTPRPSAPPGSDWTVSPLDPAAEGDPFQAWLARRPGAGGVLLYFNGNGYSAATALDRLLPRAAALGLDVVALDYRPAGRAPPAVAQVRRATRALLQQAAALGGAADGRVLVGGHSLGCWFALDLAAEPGVAGVFLLAPGTTPAEVGEQIIGAPLRWLVRLKPGEDAAQLDAPALAAAARAPVLLVGSGADDVMPPAFQARIAAALPTGLRHRVVTFEDVGHRAFLREDRVWAEIAAFHGLPAAPPGDP